MHDVTNAPLPTDGRFERQVKRDKEIAMRAGGVRAAAETELGPDGRRVATIRRPGEPFPRTSTPGTFSGGAVGRAAGGSDADDDPGHDDSSTILSGDSKTHRRGGQDSKAGIDKDNAGVDVVQVPHGPSKDRSHDRAPRRKQIGLNDIQEGIPP
jgi:hypothetical protein